MRVPAGLLAATLALCTGAAVAGPLDSLLAGRQNQSVNLAVDGRSRNYLLHTPSPLPAGAQPLIVVLHGGHGSDGNAQRSFGFDGYADARGFAVAYGDGVRSSWADGRGTTPAEQQGVDDRRYLAALVADASTRLAIDPARVYLAGVSNGGMMTLRMACETAAPFRGYAAVIANIPEPVAPGCAPVPGTALLNITGTEDPLVPAEGGDCCGGGPILGQGGRVVSVEATEARFAGAAGCGAPQVELLPPGVDDGTYVERRRYPDCADGARLRFDRVHGMGHAWPPRSPRLPSSGSASGNLDATREIVEFFLGAP